MTRISALGLSLAFALAAAPAAAQDAPAADAPATTVANAYVGLSGGYHDLGDNPFGDDGGIIGGGVVGFDVPVSSNGAIVGLEGNFHLGNGVIDSEYGVAARIGYRFPSGGVAYVRGGYQWINLDFANLVDVDGLDDDSVDVGDTIDDYLVGVGGEFPVGGDRTRLRVGVDTVSFDTVRPNVAVVIGF